MSEQRKHSPAKRWEAMQRDALRAEGQRVAAMSDEELDESLAKKGIDAKAARERGAALAAKLMAQAQQAPAQARPAQAQEPQQPAQAQPQVANVASLDAAREKKPGRSVAWWTLAAAAAALVLGGGGAAVVALNSPEPAPSGPPVPAPTPTQTAPETPPTAVAQGTPQQLREQAKARRARILTGDKPGYTPPPRILDAKARATLAGELERYSGTRAQLACASDAEAARFCGQLVGAMKAAGWTVERSAVGATPDSGATYGQRIEVATDADEATQNAADALADTLEGFEILARGPDDMAPQPSAAPLRVTVGSR